MPEELSSEQHKSDLAGDYDAAATAYDKELAALLKV